uniref:Uncharacterized protein n=1 Tax=Ananas comosus var. bracteatus TaxID=296719 RepID=A0A6V7PNS6_ANACO|nr:unnamed protein product [Ananas comosus var. bracteatus]
MAHVSDIKLIRTDTTLDLSQKAEKESSLSSDVDYNLRTWDLAGTTQIRRSTRAGSTYSPLRYNSYAQQSSEEEEKKEKKKKKRRRERETLKKALLRSYRRLRLSEVAVYDEDR